MHDRRWHLELPTIINIVKLIVKFQQTGVVGIIGFNNIKEDIRVNNHLDLSDLRVFCSQSGSLKLDPIQMEFTDQMILSQLCPPIRRTALQLLPQHLIWPDYSQDLYIHTAKAAVIAGLVH